ncbi:AMP-binding protein [Streptomyces xanthophaeus]|uniref:AMP-binding protein n=1 Tax=Streptomyces xanthophaeus TaxID=67385 RepID=UPI00398FA89F
MTQGSESTRSDRPSADGTDTVLHRFERWARDTPAARAVIAGADSLTYGQLDARANQLAHHLLDAGLPADALVAVGTARQAELLVAVLAALKAGAAYTVVDVEAPRAARQLLAAVEPFALLTHAPHEARLDDGSGRRVIRLGSESAAISARPTGPPPRPCTGPGRTAAVLCAGGAVPRAVSVSHPRLLAAYESWAEVARLHPGDRHLITAGTSVTAFAAGWTRALCSGGALVVPVLAPWRPEEIREAIEAEQVTVVHTDPAGAARLLLRDPGPKDGAQRPGVPGPRREADPQLRAVRLLTVTGDRLYLDEQAALQSRLRTGVRLINVYGLTETAGTGAWFGLPQLPGPVDDPEQLSLIGTPFPGCRVDLRAGEIRLTPPDGGDAIPTGDLARLREDGLLEFGGRIRDRITVDGRTLDPHALESALRGHEGIGSAMVAAVPGFQGVRRLVAYVAPPADDTSWPPGSLLPDIDEVRAHLADKVPSEDRPRAVVRLRTLPRNRAGQEDRAGLPQPPQAVRGHATAGVARGGGKYGGASAGESSASCAIGCGAIVLAFVARLLTDVIWPGSTDLTGVPNPWAFLFGTLYLFECLAFGLGVGFLFTGRSRMLSHGRGRALTTAAHLAVVYLLVSWWPQDNLYRLAAKQDWPRQAALVYTFNVPLMIAAAVLAFYVSRRRASPFDFED